MDVYLVGGAVRDIAMGLSARDKDWVVVGARPEELLSQGYKQVGADFPVFLHPETNEEYALARKERKTDVGYHGFEVSFSPDVSLEEDLSRRDLTMNAMALDDSGRFIDPFNGLADIANKTLRHVSPAFGEDPVRILRVARFLARLGPDWTVAPETMALLRGLVAEGEASSLVPERIWKEVEKGLGEPHPLLMLELMRKLELFELPAFAEYAYRENSATHFALVRACDAEEASTAVRFALAMPRTWSRDDVRSSRIPNDVRRTCQHVADFMGTQDGRAYAECAPKERLDVLESLAAFRPGDAFELATHAIGYVWPDVAEKLRADAQRAQSVRAQVIAGDCKDGAEIGRRVRLAREEALAVGD